MVVAVVAVRVVQPPVHEVVDVIVVRDRVMATAAAVRVPRFAVGRIGVARGMRGVDRDRVLVHVVLVRMVQMPFMQVVDVVLVANGRVTAALAMDVRVSVFVNRVRHRTTVAAALAHASN